MLLGAEQTIVSNKVGYIFISTHSNELHEACFNWLIEHQFKIIASANLSESYSEDGLLVAKSINYKGIEPIEISRRK